MAKLELYCYSENDMEGLRAILQGCRDANIVLRQERDDARAALAVPDEWITMTPRKIFGSMYHGCLWCRRAITEGHAPDCQRQANLPEVE